MVGGPPQRAASSFDWPTHLIAVPVAAQRTCQPTPSTRNARWKSAAAICAWSRVSAGRARGCHTAVLPHLECLTRAASFPLSVPGQARAALDYDIAKLEAELEGGPPALRFAIFETLSSLSGRCGETRPGALTGSLEP